MCVWNNILWCFQWAWETHKWEKERWYLRTRTRNTHTIADSPIKTKSYCCCECLCLVMHMCLSVQTHTHTDRIFVNVHAWGVRLCERQHKTLARQYRYGCYSVYVNIFYVFFSWNSMFSMCIGVCALSLVVLAMCVWFLFSVFAMIC